MRWAEFMVHLASDPDTYKKTMCGLTRTFAGESKTQHGGTISISVEEYLATAATFFSVYCFGNIPVSEPVCKNCLNTDEFALATLAQE